MSKREIRKQNISSEVSSKQNILINFLISEVLLFMTDSCKNKVKKREERKSFTFDEIARKKVLQFTSYIVALDVNEC